MWLLYKSMPFEWECTICDYYTDPRPSSGVDNNDIVGADNNDMNGEIDRIY